MLGPCISCLRANEAALFFFFFSNQVKLLDTSYSLITPRSIPFHLSPGVSQPYQAYFFPFKCCLIEREGNKNQLNYFVRNRLKKEMLCLTHPWYQLPKWWWFLTQPNPTWTSAGRLLDQEVASSGHLCPCRPWRNNCLPRKSKLGFVSPQSCSFI